jgi:hypothetical protein
MSAGKDAQSGALDFVQRVDIQDAGAGGFAYNGSCSGGDPRRQEP